MGQSSILSYDRILVGMIPSDERVLLLDRTPSPNFEGLIQQLVFNGAEYLENLRNGLWIDFTMTATFTPRNEAVFHPITFKSHKTFLGLPQLKAYDDINLYLQFRTLEPNGKQIYFLHPEIDFCQVYKIRLLLI